jgi:hypothetical protein
MLNTVGNLFTQNTGEILSVEHCGKIYLHNIPNNTFCWTLLEDLFTPNNGKYFMLNIVVRFIYIKYWGILSVELFIYTKYWDYFLLNTGKIYLHKIPRNTLC